MNNGSIPGFDVDPEIIVGIDDLNSQIEQNRINHQKEIDHKITRNLFYVVTAVLLVILAMKL